MLDVTALERRDACVAAGIDPARFGEDLLDSPLHEVEKAMWDIRFNLHMLARCGLLLDPATIRWPAVVEYSGTDAL
jgi:hypothetical protein